MYRRVHGIVDSAVEIEPATPAALWIYTVFAPSPANNGCNGAARANRTTQPCYSILHILLFDCSRFVPDPAVRWHTVVLQRNRNASSSASVATYSIATDGGWCDHHTVMRCRGHALDETGELRRTNSYSSTSSFYCGSILPPGCRSCRGGYSMTMVGAAFAHAAGMHARYRYRYGQRH